MKMKPKSVNIQLKSIGTIFRFIFVFTEKFFLNKECVAVLTMLCKKNGAVTGVGSDFLSDRAFHLARKVVVILGYPVGLDWVMGKYH